jgi:hypothetical protein
MTAFTWHDRNSKSKKMGDYHSWWLPANPKDGEYWSIVQYHKGDMPVNQQHKRSKSGYYLEGGPWLMTKLDQVTSGAPVTVYRQGNYPAYKGVFQIQRGWVDGLPLYTETQEEAHQRCFEWGVTARKRLTPTKPDFSFAQSLLELKDMKDILKLRTWNLKKRVQAEMKRLSRLQKSTSRARWFLSREAEWYLSIQFGWLPLLSDIGNYFDAHAGADKHLQQLIRDEGRPIKRRAHLYHSTSSTSDSWANASVSNGNMKPTLVTQCYAAGSGANWTTEQTRVVWCSGKSRYLLPPGPRDAAWLKNVKSRLMGEQMGASTAYNLIPWSWLVDYFTNLGDFVEACDPELISDRLVFEYAFIMDQKTVIEDDTEYQTVYTSPSTTSRVYSRCVRRQVTKSRLPASLFGWGITDKDLSLKQQSILGALGLSRL